MAVRLSPCVQHHFSPPSDSNRCIRLRRLSVHSSISTPNEFRKLVMDVKEKLENDHHNLPLGKNGRDDEDMILWFLKDRKFAVEDAVSKLAKAIKWRHEFGVSELSEESVRSVAETGKAFVHDFLDVYERPVLIVVASKHCPAKQYPSENEKLCAFLIEKALSKLPAGKEEILGIFDLRGFGTENADIKFLTFLFDVFYYYYPKRLGQVLFVEAPFVFRPIWQLAKPLLKSYASLRSERNILQNLPSQPSLETEGALICLKQFVNGLEPAVIRRNIQHFLLKVTGGFAIILGQIGNQFCGLLKGQAKLTLEA